MGRVKRIHKMPEAERDLNEMFEMFIAEKKRNRRSPDTIRSYEDSQKRFMAFVEESELSVMCNDVTEDYAIEYQEYLQNTDDGEAISPSSVNHYLRETRAFLYWCQDHCGMDRFPVTLIQEPETIKETYTLEEQKKMIRKPKNEDDYVEWRAWAVTNWVLATGNRLSTICNVRICDLNFETKEIRLVKTKNRREQMVPMSRELQTVLELFIQTWRADAQDEDFLFCNICAEKLSPSALKQSFREYTQRRGVDKTSIHAMRHTFAKAWIVNGGEITRLQALLGHKTLEMTRHYVNLLVGDLQPNFNEYNPLDNLRKKEMRDMRVTRNPAMPKKTVKRVSV